MTHRGKGLEKPLQYENIIKNLINTYYGWGGDGAELPLMVTPMLNNLHTLVNAQFKMQKERCAKYPDYIKKIS